MDVLETLTQLDLSLASGQGQIALVGGRLNALDPSPAPDVNNIANTLNTRLGHDVYKDASFTKKAAIKESPERLVWYSLSHAFVENGTTFKGLNLDKTLFPNDLPEDLRYKLVFINGCESAQQAVGSNAPAFAQQFGAASYMGWTASPDFPTAVTVAEYFFEALDGGYTVAEARNAAINRMFQENIVIGASNAQSYLKIVSGEAVVVDLITP